MGHKKVMVNFTYIHRESLSKVMFQMPLKFTNKLHAVWKRPLKSIQHRIDATVKSINVQIESITPVHKCMPLERIQRGIYDAVKICLTRRGTNASITICLELTAIKIKKFSHRKTSFNVGDSQVVA